MSSFILSKKLNSKFKLIKFQKILNKIIFLFPNFLGIIFSPLIVLFIRVIRPVVLIRYSLILSTRIGHLTENLDLYLCYKKKNLHNSDIKNYNKKIINIFYCQEAICNKFFLKMLKKEIIVFPRFILHWVEQFDSFLDQYIDSKRIHETGCYNKINPKSFISEYPPYIQRDVNGFYNEMPSNFQFTSDQIYMGEKKLKEMGVDLSKKIVCIYARDNEYLNKTYPNVDWSHHEYREFDIDLFRDTVEYLVKENYFVIRVGSLVNKELKIINENFLDYSTSGNVSDFLDIFIPYKCHFFISSSSGIDGFPSIFRKPILWPSLFPLKCIRSSRNNYMASFRHLKFKDNEKKLTMKEVIKFGLDYCYDSSELEKKNITLCKPSPEEIKMATQDMVEMLDEKKNDNINLQNLEKNFKNIFCNSKLNYKEKIPFHLKNQINFKISKTFLQTNEWWLK